MTLFVDPKPTIQTFKRLYNLEISAQFINCADIQLTELFINQTGLKFSKNLCLAWASKENFFYYKGAVSRISFRLYVNHNWNDLTILWRSKSGSVYEISDTEIDCNDIVFTFEKLELDLYLKQLYPKQQLPFQISNISYELAVTRLNLDATFKLAIKPGETNDQEEIIKNIYEFIAGFNEKSEKNERKDGVIHNVKASHEDDTITLEIDMGSTGIPFLKKFLKFLDKLDKFSKVEIE